MSADQISVSQVKAHFPILIVTGRPAAGKSEIIDFLKKTDPADRLRRFHIAEFDELDDFVYVWETFEIDDILSRHGKPRLWTDDKYWFRDHFIWNLYIERINLHYRKMLAKDPEYHRQKTTLIEFARGGERGIEEALEHLDGGILSQAGLLYIKVSYEESVRRNRKRARKGEEGSILYHSLPDEKMEFYYKTNDWESLAARHPKALTVNEIRVPYAVFENEPEKTHDVSLTGAELERATTRLWNARQ
ncbi:MAG: hypothetical protein AB1428_13970 [Bacteroidota bacterium]